MNFLSSHSNPVNILHFPGKQKQKLAREMWALAELPVVKPDNITIISIMTPDVVAVSPLHYQLTKSGIPYINTVPQRHKMWVNKHKPRYIIEALRQVKTEYALILDGGDVVIVDDLTNIIWKFDGYEKDIIFNATSNRFPNMHIEDIEGWDDFEERPLLFGPFCYLNAGVCLGKTKALKKFYAEVMEDCDNSNVPSEQYHVRRVMNRHQDTVFFDYDCRLFQAFNSGMDLRGLFPEEDAKKDAEIAAKEEKKRKEREELEELRHGRHRKKHEKQDEATGVNKPDEISEEKTNDESVTDDITDSNDTESNG